jgi:hypothetical protein
VTMRRVARYGEKKGDRRHGRRTDQGGIEQTEAYVWGTERRGGRKLGGPEPRLEGHGTNKRV